MSALQLFEGNYISKVWWSQPEQSTKADLLGNWENSPWCRLWIGWQVGLDNAQHMLTSHDFTKWRNRPHHSRVSSQTASTQDSVSIWYEVPSKYVNEILFYKVPFLFKRAQMKVGQKPAMIERGETCWVMKYEVNMLIVLIGSTDL